MRHVVLVAYYFPPDGGAGTQRPGKFCRYLPEFGWRVTVVTRPVARARGKWDPADDSMLRDLSDQVAIVRVAEPPSKQSRLDKLLDIDAHHAWAWEALRAVQDIASRDRPDVVLLTMSPFSLSLLVGPIHERLHLPVVLDLRDPWALDGWQTWWTRFHWRRDVARMGAALESADRVVANTPESKAAFLATFPRLTAGRVDVIPNGYDEADFEPGPAPRRRPAPGDAFELVHCGSILGDSLAGWEKGIGALKRRFLYYSPEKLEPWGRTPLHMLEAIRRLADRGDDAGRSVRFVGVGPRDDATQARAQSLGLGDRVSFTGYLPHSEAVRRMVKTDGLFLPLHGLPRGSRSRIVPGKTYEYLRSGLPILGCLPQGDARDLVEASGRGYCASPCDVDEIAAALARMVADWRASRLAEADLAPIRRFERRALTQDLAATLGAAAS